MFSQILHEEVLQRNEYKVVFLLPHWIGKNKIGYSIPQIGIGSKSEEILDFLCIVSALNGKSTQH